MRITWTKLTTGHWGIKILAPDCAVTPGMKVVVEKKNSGQSRCVVDRIVSKGIDRRTNLPCVRCTVRHKQSNTKRCSCGMPVVKGYDECRECLQCELCGKNKYTCGHCIGW